MRVVLAVALESSLIEQVYISLSDVSFFLYYDSILYIIRMSLEGTVVTLTSLLSILAHQAVLKMLEKVLPDDVK